VTGTDAMAKPNQAQDQTMEEILASIRRIISDDEARDATRPAAVTETPRPASNVAHLFAEPIASAPPPPSPAANVVELPLEARQPVAPIIDEEAFAAALKVDAEDILTGFDLAEAAEDEATVAEQRPPESAAPEQAPPQAETPAKPERRQSPSLRNTPPAERAAEKRMPTLLSPTSDAAVSDAFGDLADTIFGNKTRTIETVVEDMLRPMLADWLDENLPPMVERLVREEIDRVSRRRR
jgi:cell pole-organizing protein PopZ